MKRKDLEIALQRVEPFREPTADLEQYSTPAVIAADLLFDAYSAGDIQGRRVADLGCGTGILGIGAALLGASSVVGVDKDPKALEQARANARRLAVDLELELGEVEGFRGEADTVVMNPPFGAQSRHADRPFLEKAMSVASVVYSLHNAGTEAFLMRLISSIGGEGRVQKRYKFEIPHTFAFHKKAKRDVEVVLLRIQKR